MAFIHLTNENLGLDSKLIFLDRYASIVVVSRHKTFGLQNFESGKFDNNKSVITWVYDMVDAGNVLLAHIVESPAKKRTKVVIGLRRIENLSSWRILDVR